MRIWDTEKGVCNHILSGHSGDINNVACSPGGDQVASASDDNTVRVWDVRTGECLNIMIGHEDAVSFVTYSPSGKQMASGSRNGSLRVWDLEERTCLWISSDHSKEILKIAYSSRGDLIATASNNLVLLWDVTSGQCQAAIQGFQGDVEDIEWIEVSDNNYVATGCWDGTVGMWKVESYEDHCHVYLQWMATNGGLNVRGTAIQDAQGLSHLNKQLLKQRGAVGEPTHRLREASEKVAVMASVISKLKSPSDKTEETPAVTTGLSVELLEQWLEQARLCEKLVAATFQSFDKTM